MLTKIFGFLNKQMSYALLLIYISIEFNYSSLSINDGLNKRLLPKQKVNQLRINIIKRLNLSKNHCYLTNKIVNLVRETLLISLKMKLKERDQPLELETDLFFGLKKEYLEVNTLGAYSSSTLIQCNTRKYHGLFVVQQPQINQDRHVLLSSLDETIISTRKSFELATHRFPGAFHPRGYRFVTHFSPQPHPTWEYKMTGIELKKELIFKPKRNQLLIKYSVLRADEELVLRLKPVLAFRSVHQLTHSNTHFNSNFVPLSNGNAFKPYPDYDFLNIQLSKKNKYTHAPDWYYNFEYDEEKARGYEYQEDLYVPGYFEVQLTEGEEIVCSISLKEVSVSSLNAFLKKEEIHLEEEVSLAHILKKTAQQFIVHLPEGIKLNAGYHWFGPWGRDTFIALPGLSLYANRHEIFQKVIDSYIPDLKNGLFPNIGYANDAAYNSVDASMWFFKAMQEYVITRGKKRKFWNKYHEVFKQILNAYRFGTDNNIYMNSEGLIHAQAHGKALTWMDAVVYGEPVTPRAGYCVEINALWYNAIRFTLELAEYNEDFLFIEEWKHIPKKIEQSFHKYFWDESKGYLADYYDNHEQNWAFRPNQVFACALKYSPLTYYQKVSILNQVKDELLTPRGLRTLSPKNPGYIGKYEGSQATRDRAYHNGTVWPWLLGSFAEAWVRTYNHDKDGLVSNIYDNFKQVIYEYGLLSIPEIFDGDAPHQPRGAISQAWSVSELLRIQYILK